MKLVKEGCYFYIRGQHNLKIYHFSTKQKDYQLAKVIYDKFCEALFAIRLPSRVQAEIDSINGVTNRPKITLDLACDEYISQSRKSESRNNVYIKTRSLGQLKKLVNDVNDVTQKEIDIISEGWTAYANDTQNTLMAKIKAFLRWSVKKGYYSSEKYGRLTFPRKRTKPKETVISKHDFHLILQNVNDDDFRMYLKILWHTGMRTHEPEILKVRDIYSIEVNHHQIGYLKIFQPKTQIGKKCVIPEHIFNELSVFVDGKRDDDYIFIGAKHSKRFYPRMFIKIRDNLGLNKKYNLATFRHSYATHTSDKTKDISYLQKQLGHTNIKMTERYIHRNIKSYARVMEEINRVAG